MSEPLTVRIDNDQLEALDEMQAIGEADSYSEAVRMSCSVGLQELGYLNGTRDTRLRVLARRFGDAFALLGLFWLGVSFWLPVEYRLLAVPIFSACGGCYGLDHVLRRYEPRVSGRLGLLKTRDPMVTDGGEQQ